MKPETWNIGGFVVLAVVLAIAIVAEALLLLWIGWSRLALATSNEALYTFSFLTLVYFAVFSIVSARERHWFWATIPSKTLLAALATDALIGTALTYLRRPSLKALPGWLALEIFALAMISCLVVNDTMKVAMIKWRIPTAVAAVPTAP